MNLSIFAQSGLSDNSRQCNRCLLGVESMERRSLMTASPAVSAAISAVQQGALDSHQSVNQEISTLQSNIQTIKNSASTYLYNIKSEILSLKQEQISEPSTAAANRVTIAADQQKLKFVLRDEKFAINQQQSAIKAAQKLNKDVTSIANYEIKRLNKGTMLPENLQAESDYVDGLFFDRLNKIDSQASTNLDGLTSTFESGNV